VKTDFISFASGNRRFLGYGLALALFSSFGQTYFIGLFGAEIRTEFGLSHGGFGTTYAIATAASGAALIWLGRFIDRTDLRLFSTVVCLGLIAACFLMALAPGVIVLGIALFALRLTGQGLLTHAYATAMGRYFETNRGKALAIATLGHPLGEAALPSLVVALVLLIGWQETWMAFGAANLVILLPLVLWLLRGHEARHRQHVARTETASASGVRHWSRAEMLRDPRFYAIQTALLAPSFLLTGLFFHQVHLAEAKGWSLPWLATSFTGYAAASVVSMLGSGLVVDRIGAQRTMTFMPLPLAVAMALVAFFDHAATAPLLMAAAGLCVGLTFNAGAALWPELYGVRHLGAIRALVTALMVAGSAASPAAFGWLIDGGVTLSQIAIGGLAWSLGAVGLLIVALRRGEATGDH
jgi:MFS family permease